MSTCCTGDAGRPPPLIRNVASFEKPRECSAALRTVASLQRLVPPGVGSSTSRSSSVRSINPSTIDEAIHREYMGDGIILEQAVAERRDSGWAVKHRHLQRTDVGHCCHACRQPFRDLNEEVVVWTGAAIYNRFHPACAASFVLRASSSGACGQGSAMTRRTDIVEAYADGWRAPRDDGDTIGMGRPRRAVEAARRWLLSQDPSAWHNLPGDIFTTVTITENGQKKAVPGLTPEQLQTLQDRHTWMLDENVDFDASAGTGGTPVAECAICFAAPEPHCGTCIQLPCAGQHVFHIDCIWPWLKKASLCPVCRKDLRPMLHARGAVCRE